MTLLERLRANAACALCAEAADEIERLQAVAGQARAGLTFAEMKAIVEPTNAQSSGGNNGKSERNKVA